MIRMLKLIMSCGLFSIFLLPINCTQNILLNCLIVNQTFYDYQQASTCFVSENPKINSCDVKIDKISTDHQIGILKSLKAFHIENFEVNCFPTRLETFIHDLKILSIINSKLSQIKQNDLKPFVGLKILDLDRNNLKVLERNLFNNNRELEVINLIGNQIGKVFEGVFSALSHLRYFNFEDNQCGKSFNDNESIERKIKRVTRECGSDLNFNGIIHKLEDDFDGLKHDYHKIDFKVEGNQELFLINSKRILKIEENCEENFEALNKKLIKVRDENEENSSKLLQKFIELEIKIELIEPTDLENEVKILKITSLVMLILILILFLIVIIIGVKLFILTRKFQAHIAVTIADRAMMEQNNYIPLPSTSSHQSANYYNDIESEDVYEDLNKFREPKIALPRKVRKMREGLIREGHYDVPKRLMAHYEVMNPPSTSRVDYARSTKQKEFRDLPTVPREIEKVPKLKLEFHTDETVPLSSSFQDEATSYQGSSNLYANESNKSPSVSYYNTFDRNYTPEGIYTDMMANKKNMEVIKSKMK